MCSSSRYARKRTTHDSSSASVEKIVCTTLKSSTHKSSPQIGIHADVTTRATSRVRMRVMPKDRRSPTSCDMKKTVNEISTIRIAGMMSAQL